MVYSASNAPAPRTRVSGPVSYRTPYVAPGCGCGAKREAFRAEAPAASAAPAASMCTLTSVPAPAACCNGAPLHCDSGCASGYFNAAEAYGS